MLIRPGNEQDVLSLEALVTGNNICCDRGVSTTDMGQVIDVIKRSCQRKGFSMARIHK